jgi:chemotaxis protein MotA
MVVLIGLILGLGAMIGSFLLEGGHFMALMEPTAAMIVFGGTIATIVISFPVEDLKRLPKIFKVLFSSKKSNTVTLISYFKDLSFKTRKNGLLSIESEISADASMDPFVKKGLQMVVDGVEGQAVRSILELQAEMTYERHAEGYSMFEAAGGYAPTMGIIGTVMGLVHVLGNLDDPSSLGPKIAVAFIATLYGVGSANIMWLPMGAKLKAINNQEMKERTLIVEAILFIQEGVNPNTIAEKLKSFLDPKELAKFDELDKKVE